MKQDYTKPLLAVELFSLTQTVARDCTVADLPMGKPNMNDAGNCGWDMGGNIVVFVVSEGGCTRDGENMGLGCYNNPNENSYVFRS